MKTAVIGSRTFTDFSLLEEHLTQHLISEIVSGGARGADTLAEEYASKKNIPLKVFKADWNKYGRAAGPIRNRDIVGYAERVVAFWDGESRGTKNAIDLAKKQGKEVSIIPINKEK